MLYPLTKQGHIVEAFKVYATIVGHDHQEQAALSLLIAMIEASQIDPSYLDKAVKILKSVSNFPTSIALEKTVNETDNRTTSCDVKRDLIEALLRVDRFEDVKVIFVATTDKKEQAILGLHFIEGLLAKGRVEEAEIWIEEFTSNSLFQDKGTVAIIKNAMRGFLVIAPELKSLIEQRDAISREAQVASKALLEKTEIEEKEVAEVVGKLLLDEAQGRADLALAEATVYFNRLDEILESLDEINDAKERSLALSFVMEGCLKAGLYQLANWVFIQTKKLNYKMLYTVLLELVVTLIDLGNLREAWGVVSKVSDKQTKAMLAVLVLDVLLKKEGLDEAQKLFKKLDSNQHCLDGIKLALAEKMIRKNRGISEKDFSIFIENVEAKALSFLPVINALEEVGEREKVIALLVGALGMEEDQAFLSEIVVEIFKDLITKESFTDVNKINSLITDETLQKNVIRGFLKVGELGMASQFATIYLVNSKEQVYLEDVIIEIIEEQLKVKDFNGIARLNSYITDEELKEIVAPSALVARPYTTVFPVENDAKEIAHQAVTDALSNYNAVCNPAKGLASEESSSAEELSDSD